MAMTILIAIYVGVAEVVFLSLLIEALDLAAPQGHGERTAILRLLTISGFSAAWPILLIYRVGRRIAGRIAG